jgi:4'-phosphopantetheinyl transferase
LDRQPPLPLALGQVDVWLTALSKVAEDEARCYERLLSADEAERSRRFLVEHARRQFLVGRALLRTTLSRYADVAPEAWRFEMNRYGRPDIAEPAEWRGLIFNLSHTDGLVACAVGRDCELGVDVENLDRTVDVMELAPSVFAPAEIASLERAPAETRRDLFFSYWTLKESYIKARGLGISLALDGFWFDLAGAAPALHCSGRCPDDPARWRFRQHRPTLGHKLALAVAAPAAATPDLRFQWVIPAPPAGAAAL